MSVTESEIILPGGAGAERVLKDDVTQRLMEIVVSANSQGKLVDPDPLAGFILVDYSELNVQPAYQGFLKPDGSWYIKKIDESTEPKTVRFCKGATDYATAWTAKASQTYDYPTIF
jgi:hypothetical protein